MYLVRKIDRTGEKFITKEGYEIVVVKYENAHKTWIQFQDENKAIMCVYYGVCKTGKIKNPYHKSVLGVAFLGQGKYSSGEHRNIYTRWTNMLGRCYKKNQYITYQGCKVCDEWLNFQNFAKWYEENYYEIPGETMCLDKDILVKGNKIYGPSTCIFVPERINTLFVKCDGARGNLPIGVGIDHDGKYYSTCKVVKNGKSVDKYLGRYETIEETFIVYKNFKEKYISLVADEYKDRIPDVLYNAMINYVIDIND